MSSLDSIHHDSINYERNEMIFALDILGAVSGNMDDEYIWKKILIDKILVEDDWAGSEDVMNIIKGIIHMHMEISKNKPLVNLKKMWEYLVT